MTITYILISICLCASFFGLGYAFCWYTAKRKCNGTLFLHDSSVYLGISDEDIAALNNIDFVTLQVVRRNFKGFDGN